MRLHAHLPDEEVDEDQLEPLGFLQPKRLPTAQGPRAFVTWLRVGLPVVAFLVLIALIVWPFINSNTKVSKMVMSNIPDLVIQNLHFTGYDSKNQPYSISAAKATRPGGRQNVYDLDKPEGEMTLQSGNWVATKAQYGRMDSDTHQLWLGGNVQLFHDKGYQFTTDEAQVDMSNYYAWGEKPVLIQGDFGEIRGQGFRLLENGTVMVIKGPAHAVLNLRGTAVSDKPAVDNPPAKQE